MTGTTLGQEREPGESRAWERGKCSSDFDGGSVGEEGWTGVEE